MGLITFHIDYLFIGTGSVYFAVKMPSDQQHAWQKQSKHKR